jgi:sporulation protein YlmC with PRC-barrel domain
MSHVRSLTVAVLGAALLSMAAGARAQGQAGMTPGERHDWERTHRVSRIIGTDVRTKTGEKIGEIKDVVVDDKGSIRLAIVSTGGYLGVGERLHAVPWDAMTLGPKDDRVVDIDKAHLREAPGFTSRSWPNLGDERWMADNRRYYVR